MIELKNVSKFYYDNGIITTGFYNINLRLNLGEFVVITGESGSGKSTLLNIISGVDNYEEGEMYINGKETSHYEEKEFEEYRKKYIANIFQNFNLVNSYTVYQNIELILILNGYKRKKIKNRVLNVIEKLKLSKFKNTKVSKLSGGQKQKVAIARALVKETPIIVADEPTGNLDSESAREVIKLLSEVSKEKLVILVTHNLNQVENYATRIIKMNDGQIIENREIKKVEGQEKFEIKKHKNISILNKYKIGIRNTFNIKSKFIILLSIYFFIVSIIFFEYANLKKNEYQEKQLGFSICFSDLSDNRLIIKKSDSTSFSENDFNNIKKLSNVDYIVENDMFTDKKLTLERNSNNIHFSFYGTICDIKNLKKNLDVGKIPENDNEIILLMSKNHYNIKNTFEEIIDQNFIIKIHEKEISLKIVGIIYNENDSDYNGKFYLTTNKLNELKSYMNMDYNTITICINDKLLETQIMPSDKIIKGTAILSDEWKNIISENKIKNKKLIISLNNINFTENKEFEIKKTFTKKTFYNLTGYEDYEKNKLYVFINTVDYISLFNQPSYQSSVYVKNINDIDKTILDLNDLGITSKKVTDFKTRNSIELEIQYKIIRIILTIILLFMLFFISYFIIKVVLFSRNNYYTILRTLGATYSNVKKIINVELFIYYNLAFFTILLIFYLIKNNILNFEYIESLIQYITIYETILMYIILFLMSRLIAKNVSKNIFKDTVISSFNREV